MQAVAWRPSIDRLLRDRNEPRYGYMRFGLQRGQKLPGAVQAAVVVEQFSVGPAHGRRIDVAVAATLQDQGAVQLPENQLELRGPVIGETDTCVGFETVLNVTLAPSGTCARLR